MGLKSTKILGISVTTEPKEKILEYLRKYLISPPKTHPASLDSARDRLLAHEAPFVIATPNPEQIVYARSNPYFRKLINGADVALPDGVGLVWASRVLSSPLTPHPSPPIRQRIPGVEFMEDLVGLAARQGFPIALIGGRGGVALQALECLRREHPGLTGWADDPGDVDLGTLGNLGNLRDKIKKTNTRLIFVGLGAPKQEFFIDELRRRIARIKHDPASGVRMENGEWRMERRKKSQMVPNSQFSIPNSVVLMSVGGSFDEISGRTLRPPGFIDTLGFKWLWRLVLEPWRWRRQLTLVKFLWMVIREILA